MPPNAAQCRHSRLNGVRGASTRMRMSVGLTSTDPYFICIAYYMAVLIIYKNRWHRARLGKHAKYVDKVLLHLLPICLNVSILKKRIYLGVTKSIERESSARTFISPVHATYRTSAVSDRRSLWQSTHKYIFHGVERTAGNI